MWLGVGPARPSARRWASRRAGEAPMRQRGLSRRTGWEKRRPHEWDSAHGDQRDNGQLGANCEKKKIQESKKKENKKKEDPGNGQAKKRKEKRKVAAKMGMQTFSFFFVFF
nr:hypothetical protein [Pandoravirus aubagnensis]